MAKKMFFTLVLVLTSCFLITVNAQNAFSKGDQVVHVGIGLGSYYGGDGYSSGFPPLSVSYEKGVVDGLLDGKATIGVGGYLGYSSNKWETSYMTYSYGFKYSYVVLGARGVFHYQFIDKLDTYAGLMLGYNVVGGKYFGDDIPGYTPSASSTSGFGYSTFIGARYPITEKFTAFAELGYGVSALELGLSFGL
ncbi:MAG: hypothetical protein JXR53_15750 [Bacteroidales bacterium]|nr:hypothetical protein [Bacteroidales bacterium]